MELLCLQLLRDFKSLCNSYSWNFCSWCYVKLAVLLKYIILWKYYEDNQENSCESSIICFSITQCSKVYSKHNSKCMTLVHVTSNELFQWGFSLYLLHFIQNVLIIYTYTWLFYKIFCIKSNNNVNFARTYDLK